MESPRKGGKEVWKCKVLVPVVCVRACNAVRRLISRHNNVTPRRLTQIFQKDFVRPAELALRPCVSVPPLQICINWTVVLWVTTPCILEGRYQRFGEVYSLHLQDLQIYTASQPRRTSAR
jgi:hypothetical protein